MTKFSPAHRCIVLILCIVMSFKVSAQSEKQIEPMLNKYQQQLHFIQNKGQWRAEDLYRASTSVSTVQIMENGFMLSVLDPANVSAAMKLDNEIEEAQAHGAEMPTRTVSIAQHAWMVEFMGMSPSAKVLNRDKKPAYYNYFLGNDKTKWASKVGSFGEVWYNNVYNKIDCRIYTGADNSVEYDIIAYPGADLSAIKLKHTGLNGMSINAKGQLVTKTILGDMVYPNPVTYQTINGKNVPVDCRYTLAEGNVLGFTVGAHDNSYPVVIDPVALRWAIYVSSSDNGTTGHNHGIDVDASGAIFVTGRSSATNFPTTPGAIFTASNGSNEGFVMKLNQAVSVGDAGSLAWSTYIGGSGSENIYAIKLDPSGNAWITGTTPSTNYPTTTGAFQTANAGGNEAVISKINQTGDTLLYSSYMGGTGSDAANFIYVNAAGEAFIAGSAGTGFPVTAGAYQTTYGGGTDAFWAKFSPTGVREYSTYYGGTGNDAFTCVRPSGTTDMVFVGTTTSTASVASVGAYQTARVGTNNNGLVVKFSVSAAAIPVVSRTWGTYINPLAAANTVTLLCQQVDNSGNVYIGGTTSGIAASAITAGTYQGTYGGGTNDLYIGKLNATGTAILKGTYVGGSANETPMMGLNIDNFGSVYALGYTNSTNIVTTVDALQSANQGGIDALIIKMAPNLDTVKYLSYWGGTSDDTDPIGYDGVKFSNCRFYTALTTVSTDAPMSTGAYNATRTSTGVDVPAVAVWSNPPDVTSDTITGNENVCAGTLPSQGITGSATAYVLAGITRGAATSSQTAQPISYLWQKSTDLVTWTTIPGVSSQSLTSAQVGTLTVTTYFRRVITAEFCTGGTIVAKTVNNVASPSGSEGNSGVICRSNPINLSVTGAPGAVFNWTGPLSYTATGATQTIPNAQVANSGNYIVTQTVGGCTSPPDTVPATIVNCAPTTTDDAFTTNEDVTLNATVSTNDSDPDADPLTYAVLAGGTAATNGTITLTSAGVLTYVPNANVNGAVSFTYTACDNGVPAPVKCDTATATITIAAINDAPVAVNDVNSTNEDTPVSGNASTNDSDVDGPGATYTISAAPAHGTATISSAGVYNYTPAANYNGNDTFTYSRCDGGTPNLCATATVIITVNPVNDAPVAVNDVNSTNEDTPVSADASTNDSDVDGPGATYTITASPTHGTATISPAGVYNYTPAANYNGKDTFTYSRCDGGTPNLCATATVTITINAVNDAPVAINDANSTNEDTPVSGTSVTNDSDVDGPAANYTVAAAPAHGSVVVNVNGNYTYTPAANFNGVDSFTYSLCDGGTPNLCDTATVVITVNPVNDPPVITNDVATTNEDTPVSGTILTGGDSDPDGTPLTANTTPVSGPSNGMITVNTNGTYTYTPNPDFNGTDLIVISVCDNGTPLPAACGNDTLTITINAVNDAPVANNDAKSTNEDTPVNGITAANDSDVDGPAANYTVAAAPAHGSVVVNVNGNYTYTPASNFNGVDSFTYSLCDGGTPNLCDTATVVITVNPVNDPPVITNDVATTNEDTPVSGTILTGGDSDPDGTPLTANTTPVSGPSNGTITVNTNGTYTYTPNPNFNGTDVIVISVCDNGTPLPAACKNDTLIITVNAVNDAPVAVNDANSTNEDTPVSGTTVTNDSDVDGPAANYTAAATPAHGSVVVNVNGTYTYTPATNFNGVDSFTYSLCDGGTPNSCDTATVVITISAVNDAPVAVNDANSTPENTSVNGNASANDSDVDGPAANYTAAANPANGIVVLNPDGTYTYTPNTGFSGIDSFTYSLCDGGTPNLCDTARVVINVSSVNTPPVVANDTVTTNEDTPVSGTVINGSDNDPDGTSLTANTTPVSGPSNGTITVNTDGTYTYTPTTNYNGTDVVVISVCDAGLPLPAICKNDTLTITVTPVNDPPVITNDVATTTEGTPVSGTILTAGDSDPEGTPLTANTTPVSGPSNGTITVNTDGTYTYTPNPNFNGTDVIVISVCDNGTPLPAACKNDTLTITVNAVNNAPVAGNDVNSTNEDTPVSSTVTANDSDVDGPAANYTVAAGPANGVAVVNANGTYTYTPNSNFNGVDSFTYSLCDGGTPNLCDTATVVITVNPVNDPPVVTNDVATTNEGTPVSGTILTAGDSDPDGTPLTANTAPVSGPSNGTITIHPDGTYTYSPNPNFDGTDVVVISVCDNGIPLPAACANDTLTITVSAVNNAPVANDDVNSTNEDTPLSSTVTANDSDVDGPAANYTVATAALHGTVALNVNGTYTYTPAANYDGVDSFIYSLCDGGTPNLCDTATVVITINPVNDAPVAVNDPYSTPENTAISNTVATNDSDVDGPAANYTQATTPVNGTLVFNADGTFTYTPNINFNGIDSFTYSLCDGGTPNLCDTAKVVINVSSVNTPPVVVNDGVITNEDTPVSASVITAADNDPDGTPLTANTTPVSGPSNGTIVINTDGTYTYTPNPNYNGADTVVISICDAGLPLPAICKNDTLLVTVTPVNDPPVITNDVASTSESTPVSGTILTAGDSDPDGTTLTANTTPVSGPSNGGITINANGTYTYTPNAGFSGTDVVVISVCDAGTPLPAACANDTLTITVSSVNAAPVANNDVNTTNEDTAVSGSVTANDSDVDGPAANYALLTGALHGTLVLNANGSYTYTPAANYNGVDSFIYSLCDGGTPNLCDTATVVITINPVNDAPIALDDANSTLINTAVTGNAATNDSDVDGPGATYTVVNTATNGTVALASDGVYTYTPNSAFTGIDSFTYSRCDGGTPNLCDTAKVVINVSAANNPPIVSNDTATTNEDTAVSGTILTASDSDPDGTTLTANTTPISGPNSGTIVINANGTYTYTPNPNFNGLDAVIISVCDAGLPLPAICKNDTLIITINPVNDAPIVTNDVNTTAEDVAVSGTILTGGDSDPDGTALTATTMPVSGPSHGTIAINANGTYTYTPAANFNGTDVIVIAVCDSGTPLPAICLNDTLTITVTPVNDAPMVANDVNTTNEDTPVSGTILTGADSDPDGTPLHANTSLVTPPAHGTIFVSPNGSYTYIPAANFNGVDVIVIAVCDSGTPLPSVCKNDTLTITVLPVNDAPVAVNDSNSTSGTTPVSGTVVTNDSDVDGPSSNNTVVTNPTHGTVVLNNNGTYVYTPTGAYNGLDTFSYSLCDGGTPNLCDTALVIIRISSVNQRPNAMNDTVTTAEDTPITNTVATNDTDLDGPGAQYGVVVSPSHGTVSVNVNGTYTYRPAANYNGIDTFTYVLCDGGVPNMCDTATVYITITPVNDAPIASDDNNTTLINTAVTGNVKPNDIDVDGPADTYTVATPTSHGTLVLTDSGTYVYTPATDYVGCDTATISLCDGGTPNLCDTSLLVICTTSGNVAPGAEDDHATIFANTVITLNVLQNDSDLNGNLGTVPTILTNPGHGTAVVNADGTVTYTPAVDFTGLDTFSYVICDGGTPALCDTALVFITVIKPNGIEGSPIVTQTDSAVSICLPYTAPPADSSGTVVTVSCGPKHGTVVTSIDSANQQVCMTYTPDSGYAGVDTFCVTLCQGGVCSTATIPVTVNEKNSTCYWLKGISPNGDGQNDNFYVNCNDTYPNSSLKVFNRWGDEVWDSYGHYDNDIMSTHTFKGNNGRGEVLPDGTYFYIYYLNDGSKGQHAGFIQVSR